MVEVKICGLTSFEDATLALECGADYLGFVLHPESPRSVTPETMAEIVNALPDAARAVAVCVHVAAAEVSRIAELCALHAVQLHGDKEASVFADVGVSIWRSVKRVQAAWVPDPDDWGAERYVVDAHVPGLYGGTGVVSEWGAAAKLATSRSVMLGGGLTPENVAAAVAQVQPLGVDVASGVEKAPGRKDSDRVRAFVKEARRTV